MPSLDDLDAELRNWARWSHTGDGHGLECAISSIWRFWLPAKAWEDGWGDLTAPDRLEDPVDELAAEQMDARLKRLPIRHWHIIRLHYYRHKPQREVELGVALRALGDLA